MFPLSYVGVAMVQEPMKDLELTSSRSDLLTRLAEMEAILCQRDELLSVVFTHSHIAIFVVDVTPDGRYIFSGINRRHEQLSGVTNAQVRGRSPKDLAPWIGEEAVSYITSLYDECVCKKKTIESEFYVPEGGAKGWWDSRLTPILDSSDRVIKLIGCSFVITERKRIEEALRESEARFRTYVDCTPHGIFIVEDDGRCIDVNRSGERMLGIGRGDVIGARLTDLARFEHERPSVGEGSVRDVSVVLRNGDQRHWSLEIVALDSGGALWFATDNTDRLEAQKELLESNLRLSQMSEQLDDVFWIASIEDDKFDVIYVNRAFEVLWQHSVEDIYKDPDVWHRRIHEEDHQRVYEAFSRFLRGEGEFDIGFRIVRPDGTERAVSAKGSRIRDESGRITRVAGITRDVTERFIAEKARRELESQLRQSQKMEAIGQLAGGVAHDFNNLLTAILGNCEILLVEAGEEIDAASWQRIRAGVEQIQLAGTQAASLTRQLLAFSRRHVTRPEQVDPAKVIRGMQDMLARLIGEHVELDVSIAEDCGLLFAETGQLEQIVMNLVVNSAAAMPNGGKLRIALEVTESQGTRDAARSELLLTVQDDGVGMSEDVLEHVFEPFFTTKPVGEGTGLGLAMIYGIVKQWGGTVDIQSEVGAGTTVRVRAPRVSAEELRNESDATVAGALATETLLVCEDQELVRRVMCQALRALGYTVLEAEHGEDALAKARSHDGRLDLLVTDVIMPGMNGRELAEALAARHQSMRVLFVSGYTADHLTTRVIGGIKARLLAKPFGPGELQRRVREVLDEGEDVEEAAVAGGV